MLHTGAHGPALDAEHAADPYDQLLAAGICRRCGWPCEWPSTPAYSCDGGPYCESGPTYRLELPGGAGLYLCRRHWLAEMRWRKARNAALAPANRYPLEPWPEWPELEG